MTIDQWLTDAIKQLKKTDGDTARLDVEVVLADALERDRSWLHAHQDYIIDSSLLRKLNEQIKRRESHEPLAYIRGRQEFYGRDFYVSPDTLTPRPETETMIDLVLSSEFLEQSKNKEDLTFVDVGTGSGCIIITAALELYKNSELKAENYQFIGLDISKPALKIADKNAEKLKANVEFKEFDLLKDDISELKTHNSRLVILANLPYVPTDFKINLAASHEPAFAIYGGQDGLDYYRALFKQLSSLPPVDSPSPITIFTESLPPQHNQLEEIAKKANFNLQKTQDLIQTFTQ